MKGGVPSILLEVSVRAASRGLGGRACRDPGPGLQTGGDTGPTAGERARIVCGYSVVGAAAVVSRCSLRSLLNHRGSLRSLLNHRASLRSLLNHRAGSAAAP